jgi:hypothetical protein
MVKQIQPLMQQHSQDILRENFIVMAKPPGSTSHVTQPADTGNIFKGIKTSIRGLHTNIENTLLAHNIEEACPTHQDYCKTQLTKAIRSKIAEGLVNLQCVASKIINHQTIAESFKESGIYDPDRGRYNLETMISKFRTNMTDSEKLQLIEALPKLAKVIGDKGELPEADLTRAGIPETTIKDDKFLNQRRMVFLSNPFVARKEHLA